MNKQQLAAIERAIDSDRELFSLNNTWRKVHDDYNIGLRQANKLQLRPQDKQELRMLVEKMTGIDLQHTCPGDFEVMEREQILTLANDEKLAGQAVKKNRLAIKSLPDSPLKLNGQIFRLPVNSHCDLALDNIASVEHGSIWIIENYRCFDCLDFIKLHALAAQTEPLVVFRGDNVYQARTVLGLIEKLQLPVWVMGDLDPKGLSIAQSYPSFAGLIAPDITVLEGYLNDTRKSNPKLYEKQLAGCRHALSGTRYPIIKAFWLLMKLHQAGIVQEHWLLGDTILKMHPAQSGSVK